MRFTANLFVFFILNFSCLAQIDSSPKIDTKIGFSINPLGLIDFSQQEYTLRAGIEYRFGENRYAVLVEPGLYFLGTGYNVKVEIKQYSNWLARKITKNKSSYLALSYYHKVHNYSPSEIYYTDSTNTKVANDLTKIHVNRDITTLDLIIGTLESNKNRWFGDWYFGIGIRFKSITEITQKAYNQMEDNIGRLSLSPGVYATPNITLGFRIGRNVCERKQPH